MGEPCEHSCDEEKEDEIKHKDFCVSEFNTNELQTEKKERSKQDLSSKIEDLSQTIKALTEAIDKLKAEISTHHACRSCNKYFHGLLPHHYGLTTTAVSTEIKKK